MHSAGKVVYTKQNRAAKRAMLKNRTNLTGKSGQGSAALLHPQQDVTENSVTMVHQHVVVVDELCSKEVGQRRNYDDRMSGDRMRQGLPKQDGIRSLGIGGRLNLGVRLSFLNQRQKSVDIRIPVYMVRHSFLKEISLEMKRSRANE